MQEGRYVHGLEVLFTKDLPEEDIEDLVGIYWYVLPKNMRNKKVQPIIAYWEIHDRLVIVSELGEKRKTVEKYDEEDKRFCCWIDEKEG